MQICFTLDVFVGLLFNLLRVNVVDVETLLVTIKIL